MAESDLRVVVVEPGRAAYVREIPDDLHAMQKLVGGTIQAVYPFADPIALICHDEGKLLGLPINRCLRDERGKACDVICGTFFLCSAPADRDRFESLTDQQIAWCLERFRVPELILSLNGSLVMLPMIL